MTKGLNAGKKEKESSSSMDLGPTIFLFGSSILMDMTVSTF